MIGVTVGFGGHEFVLKINFDNFDHFYGIVQCLQWPDESQRLFAAHLIRYSRQFLKYYRRCHQSLARLGFVPPFASPLPPGGNIYVAP